MNLLARYSRINLLVSICIFLVSAIAYYVILSFILLQQVDDDLRIEEEEIRTYLHEHGRLPESVSVNDQIIQYTPVAVPFQQRKFTTTRIPDSDKEPEPFRQLLFGVEASGRYYHVSVSKSLEDTDSLIHSIVWITTITIIVMLAAAFLINRIVLKRLWKPFYETLNKVRVFRLGKSSDFHLPAEKVEEFDFMNRSISQLIQRVQTDYSTLKIFSETASHEIQTPLAVIRSKLDMLVQDDSLTDGQSKLLQGAYTAVEKLRKLNQSLLLLTKIENNQYDEKSRVNVASRIENKLEDFRELWQSQDIQLTSNLAETFIEINEELFDILLNNLFGNATKHNYPGGTINVELTAQKLLLENTSHLPKLETERMFQRFYRTSTPGNENTSVGLGLSIIRQICQSSGFALDYFFKSGVHIFIIRWR